MTVELLNFEIPRAATLALKTPSGSRGTYAEWRSNNKQSTEAINMGICILHKIRCQHEMECYMVQHHIITV